MITITIDTDNAAFQPNPSIELSRILRELAFNFEHSCGHVYDMDLYDINGNTIGECQLTTES